MDLNACSQGDSTLLHFAAASGNTAIARFLLDRGAAVNRRDNEGASPLHVASAWGHSEVASCLLQASADLYAEKLNGDTPLDRANLAGITPVFDRIFHFDHFLTFSIYPFKGSSF